MNSASENNIRKLMKRGGEVCGSSAENLLYVLIVLIFLGFLRFLNGLKY